MSARFFVLVALLLAAPASAADNPLVPVRQLTLPGGVAAAATCINFADPADGGPTGGVLTLDSLPPETVIQEALLYWTVLSRTDPVPAGSPTFEGVPLTPEPLGQLDQTPCFLTHSFTAAFRADVTALVTGNGSYRIDGFLGDGTFDSADLTEGASLIVIFCAKGQPDRSIVLLEGLDVPNAPDAPFRQEIEGFLADSEAPVAATLFAVAGNGQARNLPEDPGADSFVFNGVDLDLTQTQILSGGLCFPNGLYDDPRIDVTGLVDPDADSALLEIRAEQDCYTVAALALVVDTAPGLANPEPSALDRDPLAPPLLVERTPMGLELAWEDLGLGRVYHAYRGNIGEWYGHGDVGACDLVTPAALMLEEPGNHYFLAVVEGCGGAESTTGRDSLGSGRPSALEASGARCP